MPPHPLTNFEIQKYYQNERKMNKIRNNFLLAGEKFMPEMHLIQPAAIGKPGYTYRACGPSTKNEEGIKKSKKQEIHYIFFKTNYIKLAFNMT